MNIGVVLDLGALVWVVLMLISMFKIENISEMGMLNTFGERPSVYEHYVEALEKLSVIGKIWFTTILSPYLVIRFVIIVIGKLLTILFVKKECRD